MKETTAKTTPQSATQTHAVAVSRLAALASPIRLQVFRLLVQAGSRGMHAGALAQATGSSASALSFHLKDLQHAALIQGTQQGRFVVYTAQFDAMQALIGYLTENCCEGNGCELDTMEVSVCNTA